MPIERNTREPSISAAALADTADNAGKIQRRDLSLPQKPGLFEASKGKITANNSSK